MICHPYRLECRIAENGLQKGHSSVQLCKICKTFAIQMQESTKKEGRGGGRKRKRKGRKREEEGEKERGIKRKKERRREKINLSVPSFIPSIMDITARKCQSSYSLKYIH